MLNTEKIAKLHLKTQYNLTAKKIHGSKYSVGYPDFYCGNDIYVEVKTFNKEYVHWLTITQYQKFSQLIKDNKTVYILLIKTNILPVPHEFVLIKLNDYDKLINVLADKLTFTV